MPNMDAANISSNLLRMLDEGVGVGPMLVSAAKPAHILTSTATVRALVNMTALAVVQAQTREEVEKIA
jgi:malate dehydrogenase (oxaloacetate-decarboxylating)(NADP+)